MQNFGDAQLNNEGAFSAGPVSLVPGGIPGLYSRVGAARTPDVQPDNVAFSGNPAPTAPGSSRTTVDLSDRRTSTNPNAR